jgi:hypothetical protein
VGLIFNSISTWVNPAWVKVVDIDVKLRAIEMICAPIGNSIKHRDGGEVYNTLKNIFTDFYKGGVNYFEELVDVPLRKMIFEEFVTAEGRALLLSHKIADKIVQRYYDLKDYKDHSDPVRNKNLKWRLEMLQLIFKCGLVLLAASDPKYLEDHDVDLLDDVETLVVAYPFLLDDLNIQNDRKELTYTLSFLNYIRIAMPIIPAASNKHLLLKIVERLEGSNNHYVTGGGMKPATRRRMRLIEEEGNAPAVRRVNRKKNKRPDSSTSDAEQPEPKQRRSRRQGGTVDVFNTSFDPSLHTSCDTSALLSLSSMQDMPGMGMSSMGLSGMGMSGMSGMGMGLSGMSGMSGIMGMPGMGMSSITGIPEKPAAISRDSSVRFSVDFDSNIVPVDDSALPKHDNLLWNLIEAVENELVPPDGDNSLMPPPLTPSGTHVSGSHLQLGHYNTSSQQSRDAVIRPVFQRNHSLFTPDLQT